MIDYVQPEFYRFNQDSLTLVNWIKDRCESADKILDLGAGCGVIGIELANFLKPKDITFLEVQEEFEPFLRQNISQQLKVETDSEIKIDSFGNWSPSQKYDLIVCNPPYYLPGHGIPSEDEKKGVARSFLVDSWKELINLIDQSLRFDGEAFLVYKKNKMIDDLVKKHASKKLNPEFLEVNDLQILLLTRLNEN